MIINAFIEIRNDFDWPAENPEDDTEQQAKNRVALSKCGDIDVIPGLFKGRTQGPRTWQLYSMLYDVVDRVQFEQEVELFKSENPGTTDVLGSWNWDGTQVNDDGTPIYPIPSRLIDYMPDVDGSPATVLTDVNLYFGQSPRDFTAAP